MKDVINSVGIDIGTSTTQVVFSKLTMKNKASDYMIPRIDIVDKQVTYRSDIYFTPLKSNTEIDADKVKEIVNKEYIKASVKPSDMDTGAVIITGETARKQNANEVLNALSSMAGEFVVATAGPDLESVLSARGAGTDILSEKEHTLIANLDIGGGTTNIAVYENGVLIDVCCLDIGGRLIKIENGTITYIFSKISELAQVNAIPIKIGDRADEEKLSALCALMADHLAQAIHLKTHNNFHAKLYTNAGKSLPLLAIHGVTFSGGVADCIYSNESKQIFQYNDIGVLLGKAIKNQADFQKLTFYEPLETIGATVVGAGMHSTEVSGSTIAFNKEVLPIKNIPIIRVPECDEKTKNGVSTSILAQLPLYKTQDTLAQVALSLNAQNFKSFDEIQMLADEIICGASAIIKSINPLIIALENDIAKALANAIKVKLAHSKEIVCIDSISTHSGDYIDIGLPVAGGRVVPVVIKTLIFNS